MPKFTISSADPVAFAPARSLPKHNKLTEAEA
jgi:hypothetical protein